MIDLSRPFIQKAVLTYDATGEKVVFFYRMATTSELRDYLTERARVDTELDKVDVDFPCNHAIKVIVGINDSEWCVDGTAISSNPESPDYRKDWKELLYQQDIAKRMLQGLIMPAFFPVSMEVVKDELPFGKN
jgi:hypothetical protein